LTICIFLYIIHVFIIVLAGVIKSSVRNRGKAGGGSRGHSSSSRGGYSKLNLKKDGVTKIGNNMYFYTGTKGGREVTKEMEMKTRMI
jgi:hypothetical protein